MLGDSSTVLGSSSGDAAATAVAAAAAATTTTASTHDGSDAGGGGTGSNSGEEDRNNRGGGGEEGDRSFGGNRWPRQETLALLKIRSDMDVAFRDASVKGPLWDEVSRKLAEFGYHRSAKKCKEKFENVYKYHKRTKEGRTGKSDGKTYRFFDQLQALENQPSSSSFPISPPPPAASSSSQHHKSTHHHHQLQQPTSVAVSSTNTPSASTMAMPPAVVSSNVVVPAASAAIISHNTVPSATHPLMAATATTPHSTINLTFSSFPSTNPTILPPPPLLHQPISTTTTNPTNPSSFPSSFHSISADLISTSSSTSSDEEVLEGRRKRKKKWKDFFERLMKEVIYKQEELQKKFLEAIEKREQERVVREEAWRMQEMARINREREILAQERSIAAAKDAAVMAFLQKMSEQQNQNNLAGQGQPQNINLAPVQPQQPQQPAQSARVSVPTSQPPPLMTATIAAPPAPAPDTRPQPASTSTTTTNMELITTKVDNNGENFMGASSSRWPRLEVQALIKLRTNLDAKYQESGPKGPLWEEISAAMRKIGFNRSSKRCKEKWENINKYFKKVKESNKKRPEDSKTCPYFHQLDALYREKNKFDQINSSSSSIKPENTIPLMVRPEQQWPPQQDQNHPSESGMDDMESDPMDQNDEDKDGDEDDEEEDEGGGNYELVANRPPPTASVSAAE